MDKVRELQRSQYKAAKCYRERRFPALYARIWRSDVLPEASKRLLLGGTHAPCSDHR
jgi:predicted metalloendopeptidase